MTARSLCREVRPHRNRGGSPSQPGHIGVLRVDSTLAHDRGIDDQRGVLPPREMDRDDLDAVDLAGYPGTPGRVIVELRRPHRDQGQLHLVLPPGPGGKRSLYRKDLRSVV